MNKLEQIKSSEVYKQVMADSFNGIMYNVDNRDKYNKAEVLNIWYDTSRKRSSWRQRCYQLLGGQLMKTLFYIILLIAFILLLGWIGHGDMCLESLQAGQRLPECKELYQEATK